MNKDIIKVLKKGISNPAQYLNAHRNTSNLNRKSNEDNGE